MSGILPGAIRQNGYVVRDLDAAIASWLALGVGPWLTLRDIAQPTTEYRGAPSPVTLSIGFANSGPLQVELIELRDDAPSAYKEFLDDGREGFHHLAWWTDDYDATLARIRDAQWPIVQAGDTGGTRYLYTQLDGASSSFIEIMELNDVTRWLATTVADAAAEWDGVTEPVRKLF